jgi:vacuolar-type H+-ATPase subunit C/Vma6
MKLDLTYVVIRTHARIANLLNHQQTQRLTESKDIPELLDRLIETPYGRISIEGAEAIPIALERVFYEKFLERVLKIVDLTPQVMGDFLKTYYYLRLETLNLKRIIRGKFSGLTPTKILESLVPINPYNVRSYKDLAELGSVKEVVQHLKGTPYSEVLSKLELYEKHEAIWPLELELSHIFASSIFEVVKSLPIKDRPVIHNIVEFEADIENFLVAVKQRQGTKNEVKLEEIFPATYGISLDKLRDVVETKELKKVIQGLSESYVRVLSPIYEGDVALIRTGLRRHKYETITRARASDEFGFYVIMAYLIYSEIEKDNLVGIGWGKAQGISSQDLMKYVVIPK